MLSAQATRMPAQTTPLAPPQTQVPSSPSSIRAEQILAGVPQALLAVLPDRRIAFVNASAEALFAEGQACRMADRLMGVGQLKANRIEECLRQAAAGQRAMEALWFTPELRTGWMEAEPMPPSLSRHAEWPTNSLLLLIHVDEPALSQGARIDALCQQCQLTRTERYVLMLLADGLAVEAVARHLGLQVSTLRSHVRNVLGKTQAPSLMQLVRWLGSALVPSL